MIPLLHAWNLTAEEAIQVQASLREKLVLEWQDAPVNTVGGVDVSVRADTSSAAIVVLRFPELTPLTSARAEAPVTFPYIPGLLSFREGPVILAAWEKLSIQPDLLLFDGQGIAHPRGMGIAAQMGLWLDKPSIGVGKSRLCGYFDPPGGQRGDVTALMDEKEPARQIGVVLRSRSNTKPLFISPGHRMDIPHAVEFVLRCGAGYRLPEPTRWAHRVAGGESLPHE